MYTKKTTLILSLACLILGSTLAFGQKNKVELVNRIVYNSPNEKETFIKLANGTATPLNMLFAQATPDMGDIEASFLGSIRQTASSLPLPLPSKGEVGMAAIEAYLKAIHDEYFLRYDPFATMSATAYNKIFSNLTASVVYSLIFNEKSIKSYIYINGQNKNVQIGFNWGNNLCIFDPSFISTDPIRIISNDERQGYFKKLVQAKIILQEELSTNTDSLYLASNYSASFLSYRGIAALTYLNLLARDPNAVSSMETLYNIVKVDLLDDQFIKAVYIDGHIGDELMSNKYKIEDEFRLLYFLAMYATTDDRFNSHVNCMVSTRSNHNDLPRLYIAFANDVLKLGLPESSNITINRYLYSYLIKDEKSTIVSEEKAPGILNMLNDLMVKDSIINNTDCYNDVYMKLAYTYVKRLMDKKNNSFRIDLYNKLYDRINKKEMLLRLSQEILWELQNDMTINLTKGNVPAALNLYHKLKSMKGNLFVTSKDYISKSRFEALYNATRDKGMISESREIRKTMNSIQ